MKEGVLRIGTRGSELALRQAGLLQQALLAIRPKLEVEVVSIRTAGDQRTDIPLNEVNKATGTADKGVFVAAIEEALLRGEIDCAVHSCKDMPGKQDERAEIAAVLPRGVINDVMVIKRGGNMECPTIGTGSVRRTKLVEAFWGGKAKIAAMRGNVTTRLRKLAESDEMDAIILARAGLDRLGLFTGASTEEMGGRILSAVDLDKESFMPALCQGAIAVEIRRGDADVRELMRRVNHEPSECCIRAERAFLDALQADCSTPVGGFAQVTGNELELHVIYFCADGLALRRSQRGPLHSPEDLGRVMAEKLRAEIK